MADMTNHTTPSDRTYDAYQISPVPKPGPDAVAPEPYTGIYGMPAFVSVPTTDFDRSTAFWTEGLGFIDLFSVQGQVVHLRRWAFQDVLLVPGTDAGATPVAMSVSFSCVLDQIDELVESARTHGARQVDGPRDTPWNTRDVEVIAPEGTRVVLTAAKPYDPDSTEAAWLSEIGITGPR